jgi:hypothetical protein
LAAWPDGASAPPPVPAPALSPADAEPPIGGESAPITVPPVSAEVPESGQTVDPSTKPRCVPLAGEEVTQDAASELPRQATPDGGVPEEVGADTSGDHAVPEPQGPDPPARSDPWVAGTAESPMGALSSGSIPDMLPDQATLPSALPTPDTVAEERGTASSIDGENATPQQLSRTEIIGEGASQQLPGGLAPPEGPPNPTSSFPPVSQLPAEEDAFAGQLLPSAEEQKADSCAEEPDAALMEASGQLPQGDAVLVELEKARSSEREARTGMGFVRRLLQKNAGLGVREMRLAIDYPEATYRSLCAVLLAIGVDEKDLVPWGFCRCRHCVPLEITPRLAQFLFLKLVRFFVAVFGQKMCLLSLRFL